MSFAITARQLITDAFTNIGVYQPRPNDYSDAFRWLNQLLRQWSLSPLTATATRREEFQLAAGRGTPADPYLIGTGATGTDFNTTRPVDIDRVGILVTTSTPNFELVRDVLTLDAYQSITQKTLQSSYFNSLYYEATVTDGFGKIFLYPVPSQANKIVLYLTTNLSEYDALNTSIDLPPGADVALTWVLSRRLIIPYGRAWTADMERETNEAMGVYQRMNTIMSDLTLDPALTSAPSGVWNILDDSTNTRGR